MSHRIVLTCYDHTYSYSWPHVDLFVYDEDGNEISWVHWPATGDGPDHADAATRHHEPLIHRATDWERHKGASGRVYWVAEARWTDPTESRAPEPAGLVRVGP